MDFLSIINELTKKRVEAIRTSARAPGMLRAIEGRNSEGYLALIAEYKRASPSGVVRLDLDPWTYFNAVSQYATGFSVLVEPIYFLGSPIFVRIALNYGKPVLYKDFIISKEQIREARELGASSVLLIKRLLGDALWDLVDYSMDLGLEPLIEVDNEDDALETVNNNPNIMLGINSRDLGDLSVSLDRAISIIKAVRSKANVIIAESGIRGIDDAVKLTREGANAILVGTALMRNTELARELSGITTH